MDGPSPPLAVGLIGSQPMPACNLRLVSTTTPYGPAAGHTHETAARVCEADTILLKSLISLLGTPDTRMVGCFPLLKAYFLGPDTGF